MSLLLLGVGGSQKVIYLAPCRFLGQITYFHIFYSNYIKDITEFFMENPTVDYYSNYVKDIKDFHAETSTIDYYSNYVKKMGVFVMPDPCSAYTVS